MKHGEGENFKGTHGFRKGWLMFIGIPLDYRTPEFISQAVGTSESLSLGTVKIFTLSEHWLKQVFPIRLWFRMMWF